MSEALIVGAGLCTPAGTSALAALAAIRAGITGSAVTEVRDSAGEPIRASRVTRVRAGLTRTGRMRALAREALREVLPLLESTGRRRLPLFLGLPEHGTGGPVDTHALVATLRAQTDGQLELIRGFPAGRAGFFEALAAATTALQSGALGPIAVVGAVDSFCDPESLRAYAQAGWRCGPDHRGERIPGEAAGFIVLAMPGALPLQPRATTGVWLEVGRVLGTAVGVDAGLTEVVRDLCGEPDVGDRPVDAVLTCQPRRHLGADGTPVCIQSAGERLGDAGAGAGPVMLSAALYRAQRDPRGTRRALVYGSADGGRIGACVVETGAGE